MRTCQDVFILVLAGEFEVAGSRQDGLDGSHAVVVVELRGQLLRAQSIGRHDLHRQVPGVHEPVRVETDLGDHRVVGHHHRHRSKQNLPDAKVKVKVRTSVMTHKGVGCFSLRGHRYILFKNYTSIHATSTF